ncbi:MAG TPA: Slp/YeaY family lipoprotein [Thiohalobacter sp.]|nr:Slp/YeaY family lipoprotein [Thiohalobacter sp.]
MQRFILPVLPGIVLWLSGCAGMPPELAAGGPYRDLTPVEAGEGRFDGERVRWGGLVVQAVPQDGMTCFDMVGLVLDRVGEPLESDRSNGRFQACARGFHDPAIYSSGRHITFTGRIEGTVSQRIGEAEFRLPRLQADQVHLWPRRREIQYVPYPAPYYRDPFYDPYWRYRRLE